jgi:hypothetical protein
MTRGRQVLVPLMAAPLLFLSLQGQASGAQIECGGRAGKVKAVTNPDYHFITAKFQIPPGSLETLLSTTVTVSGRGASCLVAHLSAMAAPSDNYIVFQVRVDGVPMEGHLSGIPGVGPFPVVFEPEETDMNLPRMVAYNFFQEVDPGDHLVEVMVAAGSNIAPLPAPQPAVGSPVLTLEYR